MSASDLNIASISIGAGRRNQDRILNIRKKNYLVFAIADGAGGMSGGEEAAEQFIQLVTRHPVKLQSNDSEYWVNRLVGWDCKLSKHQGAGETTGIVAVVSQGNVVGASVGDSQAWIIGDETVFDLTKRQRRKPLLGAGVATPIGFGPRPWLGSLLLATDGLFSYTQQQSIIDVIRKMPIEEGVGALVDLAHLPSGERQDDISVILCR